MTSPSQAYALTGGQDHLVNAFTLPLQSLDPAANSSLTPDFVLVGHEDNVCALDALSGPRGYVVSGSWDKTARVWKEWNCVSVLGDHAQAVWAVKAIDEDLVLTGELAHGRCESNPFMLMWARCSFCRQGGPDVLSLAHSRKDGEVLLPVAKFVGHTDAVRGLTINIHIYNLPNVQGPSPVQAVVQPSQVLSGHTSFVYALDSLSSGEIVSSGEDRSARVWKGEQSSLQGDPQELTGMIDGALQQTITIPAISVWSIACLSNGDIACASSDNFIRIFTREPQRMADVQELQAYETTVSSQALNKAQVGDVQKDSLPAPDALLQPGRKEGEVRMVRNGELVEAHQWSSAANQWEKIGEVVGGVGSGQKKLYQGKEYDYVFDVDIADGIPPLKLPYNATENPYNAAYKFLERNELPLTYVDQVVAFIEKNTEAVNLGSNNEFVDPYTGASSYRPGASSASAPAAAAPRPSAPVAPQSCLLRNH
ncbi:hypothetical protein L7F22_037190 [Adiantum nelumboides]|nr:hypothetical protein [Adiantum nelumboides]